MKKDLIRFGKRMAAWHRRDEGEPSTAWNGGACFGIDNGTKMGQKWDKIDGSDGFGKGRLVERSGIENN